tara:strand:- start:11180 stop:11968 length:789 start_codon:yes stop_codon:yes gene_type:complete
MINLEKEKLKKYKSLYDKNGFVLCKQLINKKYLNFINNELIKFLNRNSKKLKGREINFVQGTKLINSVHNLKKFKPIKSIQSEKKIIQLVRFFIEEKISNFGGELFAKPPRFGLAVPIHQDNFYWNLDDGKGLTIWIALNDSNTKNGAIFYFKKSHKIGLLEHKKSYVPGSSQTVKYTKVCDYFKKVTPILKKGDVLIHNSLILHGSKKNNSNNPRLGLTVRFKTKSSKVNLFLKKNYEKQLKTQNFKRIDRTSYELKKRSK